jgi:protein arginine kinase activator
MHVTEVLAQGGHAEAHLCSACCQEVGWDGERAPPPLAQLVARPDAPEAQADAASACPACGLALADYQQLNLFGCEACYQAHDRQILELVRRWHGADRHVGRRPGGGLPDTRAIRRSELEARLAAAVAGERYEEAARLRDALRQDA